MLLASSLFQGKFNFYFFNFAKNIYKLYSFRQLFFYPVVTQKINKAQTTFYLCVREHTEQFVEDNICCV